MARFRTVRGAAALETALVFTFLMPLLGGLIIYGNYFWQAQKVDVYAPRIAQDAIVGQYSCEGLVDRVVATVNGLLTTVGGDGSGRPVEVSSVTAQVLDVLPTQGATVRITVKVPSDSPLSGILPHNGDLVSEVTKRLENVTLTTESCG